eukprot:TRINITY_DN7710_c0_g1_i1.p1 TRINITY_DN7710_c0_g1~~TRINITY_DN7710_c0_g1_i1.p1  ORF type:complete len:678 (+),score=45.61 TRINITY_DN7710_c0_g1_i1:141-2036(+)
MLGGCGDLMGGPLVGQTFDGSAKFLPPAIGQLCSLTDSMWESVDAFSVGPRVHDPFGGIINVGQLESLAFGSSSPLNSKAQSPPIVPNLQAQSPPIVPNLQAQSPPIVPNLKAQSPPIVPKLQAQSPPIVPNLQAPPQNFQPEAPPQNFQPEARPLSREMLLKWRARVLGAPCPVALPVMALMGESRKNRAQARIMFDQALSEARTSMMDGNGFSEAQFPPMATGLHASPPAWMTPTPVLTKNIPRDDLSEAQRYMGQTQSRTEAQLPSMMPSMQAFTEPETNTGQTHARTDVFTGPQTYLGRTHAQTEAQLPSMMPSMQVRANVGQTHARTEAQLPSVMPCMQAQFSSMTPSMQEPVDPVVILGPTHHAAGAQRLEDLLVPRIGDGPMVSLKSRPDCIYVSEVFALQQARSARTPLSFGSIPHLQNGPQAKCRPCMFERRVGRCNRRFLCDFCHMHDFARSGCRRRVKTSNNGAEESDESISSGYSGPSAFGSAHGIHNLPGMDAALGSWGGLGSSGGHGLGGLGSSGGHGLGGLGSSGGHGLGGPLGSSGGLGGPLGSSGGHGLGGPLGSSGGHGVGNLHLLSGGGMPPHLLSGGGMQGNATDPPMNMQGLGSWGGVGEPSTGTVALQV